jgi:hypothetical protein
MWALQVGFASGLSRMRSSGTLRHVDQRDGSEDITINVSDAVEYHNRVDITVGEDEHVERGQLLPYAEVVRTHACKDRWWDEGFKPTLYG